MADAGTRAADKRMRDLDKRLSSLYSTAYTEVVKEEKEWIKKLAELPDDTPIEKKLAYARQVQRQSDMLNRIASEIARTGEFAANMIEGEMSNIYRLNYDFSSWTVNKQVGVKLSWTQYDRNQIMVLMRDGQSPFSKIAYKNLGNDRIIVQRLGNQLAIATIKGESQDQIIKRIKNVTGQSLSQARRVAQTERTRVQSQGRNTGIKEAQEMGVEMEKEWRARMIRTRETHQEMHGEVVLADESFSNGLEYPGDPNGEAAEVINCHCYERPRVVSVSPALLKHRERFKDTSFDDYLREVDYDWF